MDSGKHGRIGDYKIGRTLGDGATCKVKMGYDTNGHKVAVKIMKSEMGEDAKFEVMKEVENMKKLDHPNVIKILDHGKSMYEKAGGK